MKKGFLAFALCLAAAATCLAQNINGYSETESADYRTRAAITLGFKPTKSLSLTISEEVRFNNNATSFDRSYTSLGINYSPVKRLEIIGGYTFGYVNKLGVKTVRHRANAGLEYTLHAGDFRFALREMVQSTWRTDSVNVAEKPNPALVLRSRIRISYKVPAYALTPYIGFELYNTLNNPTADLRGMRTINGTRPEFLKNYICRYRGAAGLKYKFNAHTSLDAFCRYDWNINYDVNVGKKSKEVNRVVKETEKRFIMGIEVTHNF